jgi:poly-gamma-glutamate synthase PgsB/CapB
VFLALVVFYAVEHIRLLRIRGRIPLRICITGARGKSSVVRLLTAVLRESGRSVLAKTTGSRPMLLLPDGSESELQREGRPSVLEQIQVLRRAAAWGADVVVAEMMAIRPEILNIESRRIFQPSILLITNARPDHREHWGQDSKAAARSLAAAVCSGSEVFIPADENMALWEGAAVKTGARLHPVTSGSYDGPNEEIDQKNPKSAPDLGLQFVDDLRLVEAAAGYLGIAPVAVREGIKKARPDLGGLKIWRWQMEPGAPKMDCVSAFAANDPESTRMALQVLEERGWIGGKPVVGLLALRRDRGDRTRQWLEAFRGGAFAEIRNLYVIGDRNRAFERGMSSLSESLETRAISDRRAGAVMAALSARTSGPEVIVIGMGNMVGAGRELVEYWEQEAVQLVF